MKIGYLYQKDEKEVKKDLEKDIEVEVGISLSSLYDEINIYEINHPSNPEIVVALLKQNIMLILGKIEQEKDENKTKN